MPSPSSFASHFGLLCGMFPHIYARDISKSNFSSLIGKPVSFTIYGGTSLTLVVNSCFSFTRNSILRTRYRARHFWLFPFPVFCHLMSNRESRATMFLVLVFKQRNNFNSRQRKKAKVNYLKAASMKLSEKVEARGTHQTFNSLTTYEHDMCRVETDKTVPLSPHITVINKHSKHSNKIYIIISVNQPPVRWCFEHIKNTFERRVITKGFARPFRSYRFSIRSLLQPYAIVTAVSSKPVMHK